MPPKPTPRKKPAKVSVPEPVRGQLISPGLYKDKSAKREPYSVDLERAKENQQKSRR